MVKREVGGMPQYITSRTCIVAIRKLVVLCRKAGKQGDERLACAAWLIKAFFVGYHSIASCTLDMLYEAVEHVAHNTESTKHSGEDTKFRRILAQTTEHLAQNKHEPRKK